LAKYLGEGTSWKEAEDKSSASFFVERFPGGPVASAWQPVVEVRTRSFILNSPDFVIPTPSVAEGEGSVVCRENADPSLRSG
jgi:hypothetical protein